MSYRYHLTPVSCFLFPTPVSVNEPMKIYELEKIRNSVNRQAPLGEEGWQIEVASQYGLLSTLGNRGRPKKEYDV